MTTPSLQPTQPQIRRLYTLASRAGWRSEQVHTEIRRRYGVESTKQLTARQYEQFSAFLEGMIRAAERQPKSNADAGGHHPKVHNTEGVERILREEWPAILIEDPALAGNLVEALDAFRLTRFAATISPRVLTAQVQLMRKLPREVLASTAAIYLERYTTRPERYFFGIARGEKYRQRRQRNADNRKAEAEQRGQRDVERRVEQILAAAGAFPVPAVTEGCICSRGRLDYHPDPMERARTIPCPWCSLGIEQLHLAVRNDRLGRIDWQLVRDQLEEQHANR